MSARRTFFFVRVGVLLFILFLVVLYAVRDVRSRRARNEWKAPVDVAIVLVHVAGTNGPTADAMTAFRDRVPELADRLAAEAARIRPGLGRPFRFRVFGPVDAPPPPRVAGDGIVDLARYAWDQRVWLGGIDPAAGVVPDHFDTRIYVEAVRPASERRSFVEGESQEGGRIGVVAVELDPSMADFTLFVVAHELLHTLGATDKYGPDGSALDPQGLAEPLLVPRYPQRYAEVMARSRPLAPGREAVPASLAELAVGAFTAKEIGWSAP